MMKNMKTLRNEYLTIQVKEHGAELCSIQCEEKEYLWQADPTFWGRHSPVLFPIVGKVWNDCYRVNGREYTLPQHGFGRDMDFCLVAETENELRYRLDSSAETLAKYPYRFALEIAYRLVGKQIEVLWQVTNKDTEEIHFQIGAHPAFYYPDFHADDEVHGYFAFDRQAGLQYICPKEKGCVSTQLHALQLSEEGLMPIDSHTFDCDTYMFENGQLHEVTLLDKERQPVLTMKFDTPLVALWSPTQKYPDCPFVCIEPWYGRADRAGYTGEYRDKEWMQHLAPGRQFQGGYTIEIR